LDTIEDTILLGPESGSEIARAFGVDEIAVEIERAVEQVQPVVNGKTKTGGAVATDESSGASEKKS
jgi:hypothetical protein